MRRLERDSIRSPTAVLSQSATDRVRAEERDTRQRVGIARGFARVIAAGMPSGAGPAEGASVHGSSGSGDRPHADRPIRRSTDASNRRWA
jgi:hypothetical protein